MAMVIDGSGIWDAELTWKIMTKFST